MNNAQKKFQLYAILVVFALLTVLLGVINGVNFTMASQDADRITQTISDRRGSRGPSDGPAAGQPPRRGEGEFRMGPMGPDSPELNDSLRYFTVAFSLEDGEAQTVAHHISAVSEQEAKEWASELVKGSTGWTRSTYRYRVYREEGRTCVTVIDQGRELLPSYRILLISGVGEALCLLVGWFVLQWIGRKVYSPLEEADRRQKHFIQNANKEFRLPLTIIGGNTELIERTHGPDDQTRSTRRQLSKLNELVERLGTFGIFEDAAMRPAELPLSEHLTAVLDREAEGFAARGLRLEPEIEPEVRIAADPEAMDRMIDELVANELKYARTFVGVTLKQDDGAVRLEMRNDADLPEGACDEVFDRFTTLENAEGGSVGAGLGLAFVKQIVSAHHGRASAAVKGGIFSLRITFPKRG